MSPWHRDAFWMMFQRCHATHPAGQGATRVGGCPATRRPSPPWDRQVLLFTSNQLVTENERKFNPSGQCEMCTMGLFRREPVLKRKFDSEINLVPPVFQREAMSESVGCYVSFSHLRLRGLSHFSLQGV